MGGGRRIEESNGLKNIDKFGAVVFLSEIFFLFIAFDLFLDFD